MELKEGGTYATAARAGPRDEPSRLPTLASGTGDKYDELNGRSWIYTLEGGALRLYTRSTPESKGQSSPDKSRGERSILEVERHVPLMHEPVSRSRVTYKVEH
jgi:hypothetical protein